ncbi:hypothetical protein AYO38_06670 [bacterium SCGC AG-212-C10]|nr:hypothetical protein AYO38_06670 [bacterium SCGC AG-212-C10]
MKVVFFEDVEGTANAGEVKDVKNGFARNFLLPRNIAGPTTKDNLQRGLAIAQKEARKQEKLDADARKLVEQLGEAAIEITARVGESGRLFGSVTNRDIAEKLNAQSGLSVDSHIILLPEPIRELGERKVTIRFTRNVHHEISVDVVPDEESKPIVAKLEAERLATEAALAKRKADAEYAAGQKAQEAAEAAELAETN